MKEYNIWMGGESYINGMVENDTAAYIKENCKDIGKDKLLEFDDTDGYLAVNLKCVTAIGLNNIKDTRETIIGFIGGDLVNVQD